MKLFFTLLIALMSLSSFSDELKERIPYPFYDVQKDGQNTLTLINSGIASMQRKLELIQNATEYVELEYFIFQTDQASKLLVLELIKAAERGVTVKLLVDGTPVGKGLQPHFAHALIEKGVQVKYYNNAPLYKVSTINFRNHRKLFVVDDKFAITGGRNVKNAYFDMSKKYNFLDQEILIEGPMVRTLRDSFEAYFEHEISTVPKLKVPSMKRKRKYRKYMEKKVIADEFVTETQTDIELREKIKTIATPIIERAIPRVCNELTYVTDLPGGNFKQRIKKGYFENFRHVRKVLNKKISEVNHALTISSPYILNNRRSRRLMKLLLSKDVDITLYTNSLGSTDVIFVAAHLYNSMFKWAKWGMKTYVHAGEHINEDEVLSKEVAKAGWGTHSKTHIYESKDEEGNISSEVMIGTYNIDNRSNFYNNELAVFCKDTPEFTEAVRDNIQFRINKSYRIYKNRTARTLDGKSVNVYGTDKKQTLKLKLLSIPAWLIKFLL